ncbi:ribosomal protein L5 domain-containing protein [Gorgonomyces haynaldii]|nr:ribosomal protein L5 domain-containing protein [Gorgonomyces haynaldii]
MFSRLARHYSALIVEQTPVRTRLEEFYYNSMMQDLMVLSYDHHSPDARIEKALEHHEFKRTLPSLREVYSTPLHALPTLPERPSVDQCLLTTENEKIGIPTRQVKFVRKLKNPIDYTSIPTEIFNAPPPAPPKKPFAPWPSRLPALRKIGLRIWSEDASANKFLVLNAIMLLQSITGVRADPVLAERGDATRKIRVGMPMGAKLELTGKEMHLFMDKMVQCVLPRISDFSLINPIGDDKGSLSFMLPAAAVGYFPDIEPHFDMFPRMFETKVTFYTSGQSDAETCMVLSGFKLPLGEERIEDVEEVKKVDDPWARIKEAKTREERKAIAAEIMKQRKSKE